MKKKHSSITGLVLLMAILIFPAGTEQRAMANACSGTAMPAEVSDPGTSGYVDGDYSVSVIKFPY